MKNIGISKIFKVLSNPTRLSIFMEIVDSQCDCDLNTDSVSGNCVTMISKKLDIPQPTVSNHVKELIKTGLVQTKRKGKNVFLFKSGDVVQRLAQFSDGFVSN